MEITHIFTENGTYQLAQHEDGTFSISYVSSWNSMYNWEKKNLDFAEFTREFCLIAHNNARR